MLNQQFSFHPEIDMLTSKYSDIGEQMGQQTPARSPMKDNFILFLNLYDIPPLTEKEIRKIAKK